jgi:hypothetical protein
MTYEEAIQFLENSKIQFDKLNSSGFTFDEIIVVPTAVNSQQKFFQAFLLNRDAKAAIAPYVHEDVTVWAIDSKHLKEAGVLFYDDLAK